MLLKHSNKLLLLTSLSAVAGCSSLGSQISGNYEFSKSKDMGLVAASVSVIDQCDSVGNLIVYANSTNKTDNAPGTDLYGKRMMSTPDFMAPEGYFTVLEFPAGDYEFTNVWITGLTLMSRGSSLDTEPVSFKVVSNKTTYIGELEFVVNESCNNYTYKVKDNWHRDAMIFRNRVPNINPNTVAVQLAKIKNSTGDGVLKRNTGGTNIYINLPSSTR